MAVFDIFGTFAARGASQLAMIDKYWLYFSGKYVIKLLKQLEFTFYGEQTFIIWKIQVNY